MDEDKKSKMSNLKDKIRANKKYVYIAVSIIACIIIFLVVKNMNSVNFRKVLNKVDKNMETHYGRSVRDNYVIYYVGIDKKNPKLDENLNIIEVPLEEDCLHVYIYKVGEKYLEIDTNPFDYKDAVCPDALTLVEQVNSVLELPSFVNTMIGSTSAMDGVQTYEGEKVKLRWSYHPDSGLEIIYEAK